MNDLIRRRGMVEKGYEAVWNQLVQNGNFADGLNGWMTQEIGELSYRVEDGYFKETLLVEKASGYWSSISQKISDDNLYGHQLCVKCRGKWNGVCLVYGSNPFVFWSQLASGLNGSYSTIRSYAQNAVGSYVSTCIIKNSSVKEYSVTDINIMDLTAMFGVGNEPSSYGVLSSWLQENGINPNEYIPYCAGETRIMTKPSWIQ